MNPWEMTYYCMNCARECYPNGTCYYHSGDKMICSKDCFDDFWKVTDEEKALGL